MAEPVTVIIEDEDNSTRIDPQTGVQEIDTPDGGVVVNFGDHRKKEESGNKFYDNLADEIDSSKLGSIANDLIDGIEADDRSRQGYLSGASRGLELMGIKLEEPRSAIGDSSSSIEGMATVTNPLLLEAVLKGWANAQGEFLPAGGPVKVDIDGEETIAEDDLAEAFERDFNHYLTDVAKEYYPDTSYMLLWGAYFKGSGFKKIYRCPMRRRPVSESVDAKDLIVSDTAKDLRSCARITHQIEMRPSVMKRMMLLGAYRDVTLTQPQPTPNTLDQKIAATQGVGATPQRREDQPHTVWETQCELDLEEFAPGKFKGEGIPLPYLVTIDKDSRAILAIRRDWNEDDEECERQRMYVRWPYVPGPGFYGTGLLGILGNASAAMTAAWREALDAGMFASFPGGLIAKLEGRQNTSNLRVGPGEFFPIATNGMPINQVVMPNPYRDVTPGLMTLMDKITEQAKGVGGTADIPTAEGIQNVPVGTMLAQIEQATKVMAAAHKGMHQAQSEEIELIGDLFRSYPEDFWRFNRITPRDFWNEEKLNQALDNHHLVPVSDPNVPSHIHRVAKAIALIQLGNDPKTAPYLDGKEIAKRCLRALKEDEEGLLIDAPANAGPDPKMVEAQAKVAVAQAKVQESQNKMQMQPLELQAKQEELVTKRQLSQDAIAKERIIHAGDMAAQVTEQEMARRQHALDLAKEVAGQAQAARDHSLDVAQFQSDHSLAHAAHGLAVSEHLHEREMAHREHGLAVSEHLHERETTQKQHEHEREQAAHEREMAEKDHALGVYEAKHPPKPAASKPKKKK